MIYQADLINEVVLLLDATYNVVDAFAVDGKCEHESLLPAAYYTYRSLLTQPGFCCLCGKPVKAVEAPCTGRGGTHAFAGILDRKDVPDIYKADFRNIPLQQIRFEELSFFVEADNLFAADQIRKPVVV